jgi:hypothetical protein
LLAQQKKDKRGVFRKIRALVFFKKRILLRHSRVKCYKRHLFGTYLLEIYFEKYTSVYYQTFPNGSFLMCFLGNRLQCDSTYDLLDEEEVVVVVVAVVVRVIEF